MKPYGQRSDGDVRQWGVGPLLLAAVGLALLVKAAEAGELNPQQIYAKTAKAVVLIWATTDDKRMGGAGSIIHPEGWVLTNAHVVVDKDTGEPFRRITVILKPERVTGKPEDYRQQLPAALAGFDLDLDLALLKLTGPPTPLPVIEMGDPALIRIGDRVAAIGHPESGGTWSLTTGVISREWEDFKDIPGKHVFQTETGMNRGNSGGPLLDAEAHQVGVNTAIARLAKDGLPITSISFSVKSSVARAWLGKQGVRLDYARPLMTAGPQVRPEEAPSASPSATPAEGAPVAQGGQTGWLAEVKKRSGVTLVAVSAKGCVNPCQMMARVWEELSRDYAGRLHLITLDFDQHAKELALYGVKTLPASLLFKDGRLAERFLGAVPKQRIRDRLEALLAPPRSDQGLARVEQPASPPAQPAPEEPPIPRPYNLDQLLGSLARVEKDLEEESKTMSDRIREVR